MAAFEYIKSKSVAVYLPKEEFWGHDVLLVIEMSDGINASGQIGFIMWCSTNNHEERYMLNHGSVSPNFTDEQIAEDLLNMARSDARCKDAIWEIVQTVSQRHSQNQKEDLYFAPKTILQ